MSQHQTIEEMEAREEKRRVAARLDAPVPRRELLAALDEMKGRANNDAEYSAAIMLEKLREILT